MDKFKQLLAWNSLILLNLSLYLQSKTGLVVFTLLLATIFSLNHLRSLKTKEKNEEFQSLKNDVQLIKAQLAARKL